MDVRTPSGTLFTDLDRLLSRSLPDGGYTDRPGGTYRTDATAWAAILLDAVGHHEAYTSAAKHLASDQHSDGRVPLSPRHPGVWWPTALAVIAWAGVDSYRLEKDRAVQFLLHVNGTTAQKQANDPTGHDTTLRGWSWIEGTHSWIEPTSLSLLACAAVGLNDHPRIDEGIRLLLNRQLPQGGWNYGNTTMFGQALHPMPESTGAALAALAGKVPASDTARSLEYLRDSVDQLRTPISLGWSLLGLAAWNSWPSNGESLVQWCLAAQSRYGEYDTASLSLMLMAAVEGGVLKRSPSSSEKRGEGNVPLEKS